MVQEKWLVDSQKVIDFELVRSLKVSMIGGQVNIVGHDEPGARVEVHSVRGKAIKISISDDALEIDHPQLSWDNFVDVFTSFTGRASADVSILVPRDVALKFGVVTASALISGLQHDATISTVSGDLVIDDVTGDLQLNAVNGEIAVRDHTGNVTAKTVSGDITASGDIPRTSCDSVSGSVFLDLKGAPDAVRVNTVSGSVTVRLETGVAAQYTISTVSGRLQLDDSEITGVRGTYRGKYGVLEQNWLDFKASTVSGRISVLHAVTV
jgi:DUF4097 and DUF4098 domain-containing protein YvlB